MVDKGIIFSAPMVRALLDGRKTQTRRLVKPQPGADATHFVTWRGRHIWDWPGLGLGSDDGRELPRIPYAPGDRLYVRETWRTISELDDVKPSKMFAATTPIEYTATGDIVNIPHRTVSFQKGRPSIFMPRWASRLTLTVTDVRVQRVAEISEADALAEGAMQREGRGDGSWTHGHSGDWNFLSAKDSFRDLWNGLHTKPGETWADNPWVVAVSFTVAHGNIDRSPE